MKRAEVIQLIKDNEGVYSSSITNSTTHVIVEDVDQTTGKVLAAKAKGVKIVTVDFLKNFM